MGGEEINKKNNTTKETPYECEVWLNGITGDMPIPQFVIDKNHKVVFWNGALEKYSGIKAEEIIGTDNHWKAFYPDKKSCLADFLLDDKTDNLDEYYPCGFNKSALVAGGYEATSFFPEIGSSGKWLHFTAALIKDNEGRIAGAVETLEDITELKKKEKELIESQMHYKRLVENINDVIFTMNLDGIITYISPVIKKIYGYSPDEVQGRHFSGFIHSDDLKIATDGFIDRTRGIFEENIFRILTKDGKERYVRTTQTPILSEKKINGFNYVMTDITEQCLAQQALKESERKFRGVAERSIEIIVLTDENGIISYTSPSIERILGYAPEDITGKNVLEIVHTDSISETKINFNSLLKKDLDSNIFEAIVRKKNGDYATIEYTGTRIVKKGLIIGLQLFGHDITQKKLAEEALKESQYRFRELFNSMKSGVAIYRPSDNLNDFIIIDFNHGAEIIDKIKREDVIGKSLRAVYPGIEEFGILDVFKRVSKTGKPEIHPVSQYKDKRIMSWRENYVYRLPSGEIVAIYDDLTEVKKAEEAARKTAENSIFYIKETAMRLKNPIEMIRENLLLTSLDIKNKNSRPDDVILNLRLQAKNMEQIIENINELNSAIIKTYENISPDLRKYLTE